MHSGRRHETPGSETKDFVINGVASSMNVSIFTSVPFSPKSHLSGVMLHIQWICIAAKEPRTKGTILFKQAASYPVPLSKGSSSYTVVML